MVEGSIVSILCYVIVCCEDVSLVYQAMSETAPKGVHRTVNRSFGYFLNLMSSLQARTEVGKAWKRGRIGYTSGTAEQADS